MVVLNIFRVAGDLVHLASIGILLSKINATRSVSGLSFKTQALYMLVYATRYLDLLFKPWVSLYNTVLKLVYIGSSAYVLRLMTSNYKATRSPSNVDTFKVQYLIGFSALLALIMHLRFTILELLWSFSIWLESVAILPQLFMIQRTGKAETMTTHYIFALGLYRVLYMINWFYRWIAGNPQDWISVLGGIIQSVLYSDFFYVYYSKVYHGQNFTLPV